MDFKLKLMVIGIVIFTTVMVVSGSFMSGTF